METPPRLATLATRAAHPDMPRDELWAMERVRGVLHTLQAAGSSADPELLNRALELSQAARRRHPSFFLNIYAESSELQEERQPVFQQGAYEPELDVWVDGELLATNGPLTPHWGGARAWSWLADALDA